LQPAYRDVVIPGGLPNTERLTNHTLILPVFHALTEAEQDRVITVLRAPVGDLA
jgi:dTDP-4-amino-4,6-dideoxygalactose transaminase